MVYTMQSYCVLDCIEEKHVCAYVVTQRMPAIRAMCGGTASTTVVADRARVSTLHRDNNRACIHRNKTNTFKYKQNV